MVFGNKKKPRVDKNSTKTHELSLYILACFIVTYLMTKLGTNHGFLYLEQVNGAF